MKVAVRDGAVLFDVKVVPRASRERLGPDMGERLKVSLNAPPVDGAANEALRALVAKTLSVARGAVSITAGLSSRNKTVRVEGVSEALVRGALLPDASDGAADHD